MVGGNGVNQFRQYAGQNVGNQNGIANQNPNENGNVVATRAEGNAIRNNDEEFDLMANATDLHEIEKVNANCILMANLQQASTSGTQTNKAHVYDSDGSAEGLPKIDETHALSKPVTSNSVPTPQESKVVNNDNVIAPRMFRINPFKTSREEKSVPTKSIKASVRTNPITISQPHALTKKSVNSNSNGLYSKGVDNTTKTRRPHPRSNTKNDRVPYASKSSYKKNKKVKVEEHPRNLLLSKNKKCMSSECNNVKLAIQNEKAEVVCAMCHLNLFMVRRIEMLKAHDMQSEASYKFCLEVHGNWLGHNLFSVGQFYDSDLEVAFRRNTCFVRNLKGGDLLKGNRTTNLYTINLHEMAYTSPICLMAHATSTKSWLWHQRLSHLNFDTINDLARNDLVTGLPKFKYHKKHLYPSFPNSKQRLHLLDMDLCGPIRVESINGKWYVMVIVVDYSRYTWVHFLRSKDEAPEVIKTFLKKIAVLLQALVIMVEAIATACYIQNHSIIHRRFGKTPYELINGRKPDISFLHVFRALWYPKNDHEDIRKLGAKGMTSGQISLGLDLTYAPLTITTQQPTECELDLLFEAMYDDYIGGQPSANTRTASAAQAPYVLQTQAATR
nr:retrovirus-related Pol polyprotein from transposon TNT 1-94 [Tanacetum cinerariifolium]